ncbi:MAG: hypothetical protein IPL95_16350 [Saprospiraceae bacterium]|nr:hypothetical protein [Saprospiraceae bacterium]
MNLNITITYTLKDEDNNIQIVTKLYDHKVNYFALHQAKSLGEPIIISQNIGEALSIPSSEPPQSNFSLIQEIEAHLTKLNMAIHVFLYQQLKRSSYIDIVENLWIGTLVMVHRKDLSIIFILHP